MALTNPSEIADAAEAIYKEKYQAEYEQHHDGKFVVVDVTDERAYLGVYAEEALGEARRQSPHGVFHLMKVGAPGAFKVSYIDRRKASTPTDWNWPLRSTG